MRGTYLSEFAFLPNMISRSLVAQVLFPQSLILNYEIGTAEANALNCQIDSKNWRVSVFAIANGLSTQLC